MEAPMQKPNDLNQSRIVLKKDSTLIAVIARVIGVGIETADMLVHEVLSRKLRDRRAVARYAGLTGAPDESGSKRREKGLAKAGNARVRRGMVQLAWRFLLFQKNSALSQWYRTRTESAGKKRKTMIVALARKLLIALWRLVTTGKACSAFTRVAACTLALSPIRDTLSEGFSHFVTSMTAPVASGWSGRRVGLAPTGERRLVTAHTQNGRRLCIAALRRF